MTPTMERAEDVLQAYAIMSSSMILLLASLQKCGEIISQTSCSKFMLYKHLLSASLYDVDVFAAHRVADFHHRLAIRFVKYGATAALYAHAFGHFIGQIWM